MDVVNLHYISWTEYSESTFILHKPKKELIKQWSFLKVILCYLNPLQCHLDCEHLATHRKKGEAR